MLDQQDLKWIASTSTELNSILQQISRYCDLSRRHKEQPHYVDLMGERVERAAKTAQALFDKVTSNILTTVATEARAARRGYTSFTVLPPPTSFPLPVGSVPAANGGASKAAAAAVIPPGAIPSDIVVKNPKGKRELLLLVDDEADVAELAAEMLAQEGYKVIVAPDGFAALKTYDRIGSQIGLMILDF